MPTFRIGVDMRIRNFTPRAVQLLVEMPGPISGYVHSHDRVLDATFQHVVWLPSEGNARVQQFDEPIREHIIASYLIPVVRVTFGVPIDLPSPEQGTMLLVNPVTAYAAKDSGRTTDDLFLPNRPVRGDRGTIIGYTRFAVV
jgi:hypothetical protein